MFDIGGVELLVIAAVAILVVGPRELPAMLRGIGKVVRQVREMTGSVQRQFNDALKEAELDDVKKTFDDVRSLNPAKQIRNTIAKEMAPLTEVGDSLKNAASDVKNIGKVGEGAGEAAASKATTGGVSASSTASSTASATASATAGATAATATAATAKPAGDGSTLTQSKPRLPKSTPAQAAAPAGSAAPANPAAKPAAKASAKRAAPKTATAKPPSAAKPSATKKPAAKKPAAARTATAKPAAKAPAAKAAPPAGKAAE